MDVETRCDFLTASAKSAADPFYTALLGSVWSRQTGIHRSLLWHSEIPTESCQCSFTQWVGMCVLHIRKGSSLPVQQVFFILNSFKASNEATMVNITEEKVNKDSPSSQNILALSTKSFREVTRYTVLCFCCLLS